MLGLIPPLNDIPAIPATATLTTSYVGKPCPEELVTFTCTVSGTLLRWDPSDSQFINVLDTAPLNVPNMPVPGYTVTRIPSSPNSLTSTLSRIAEDGVSVTCVSVGTVTIQLAGI